MITYVKGDATAPTVPGNKIIAHVCNDIGGWGRGFVLSVSKRWPEAERQYRRWYQEQPNMPGLEGQHMFPGASQYVLVDYKGTPPNYEERTFVANMVAQKGIFPKDGVPPIRYVALKTCLTHLGEFAEYVGNASIHMPRIGCGLAGGTWTEVEKLIEESLSHHQVYVYDFVANDERDIPWNK